MVLGGVCAAIAVAAACSPGAGAVGTGVTRRADTGWTDTPTPPPRPHAAERWDLASQLRPLRAATQRGRSEHLGGNLDGEVLASPASGYPLRGPTPVAAVGATLVERLFEPPGTEPTLYFVMTKHAPGYDAERGDWEYAVVARDGAVEERGKLDLCARCHAEAPHDHLFGGAR